jgi:hypothetical protein
MANKLPDPVQATLRQQLLSKLTPNERANIEYHRSHLRNKTYFKDPSTGDITTFYGMTVKLPDGRFATVPSYLGGGKFAGTEEEALQHANKIGLKYPIYKSEKEALAAESRVHDVMQMDTDEFLQTGQFQ